jgi:hypothetical protein
MLDYTFSKQFEATISAPETVPDHVLAAINRYAHQPATADQVYAAQAKLANDRYDRSDERFPEAYLQRFAATMEGKSLLPGHDRTGMPLGKWVLPTVEKDADGAHLAAWFYVPAGSDTAEKVRLGIAKDVSINFRAAGRTCDLCGSAYDGPKGCQHTKGIEYDGRRCTVTYSGDPARVEALEGSLVWLACQYGTQVVGAKAAGTGSGYVVEIEDLGGDAAGEKSMLKEEEVTALQTKAADLETKVKSFEEQVKALEKREDRAKDGDAYHEWLRGEIARKMSMASGKSEDADTILKKLDGANLTTLKQWEKLADERLDAKFPPSAQSKQLGEGGVAAPGPGQREPQPFDPHASLKRAY